MRFPNRRLHTAVDGEEDAGVSAHFRNPFVHELRFTPLQKLKIAVMTVTLFPVRLLFAAFMMLLAWPFAFVATVGRSEDAVEPLSWWRWLVDLVLKVIMRAMWFSGGFHWVRVKGRPALPSEAPILTMAPHSSYFDAIPVTMTMASIVMKAESKDIPVWGTLIKFIRPVFVSRSDQDSRRKTVEEIKRRASSNGEWPQIMIFPEGTCTNRSCLIAFKPGAFIPGVPVQPVLLRYPNEMDTISWTWQGPGAFKILWLTLCQLHNSVEIEYLPTYTPSEEEKKDPALFANNVRRIMAKALGSRIIDYSFEDCQLAMGKGPLRLPKHTCLLEFARLVRCLGLKTGVTDEVLHEEASRARKLCGNRLDMEGFSQYLNQPMTEAVQDVFSLFEEHGKMDVREYVIALSVVCRPFRYLETIKLAFRMFEAQEDGAVVEDDLAVILKTALGIGDFAVCDLFRAIDCQDKGKITFDDFCRFLESCPDFVAQYHCLSEPIPQPSRESTSPSESQPSTNGFCADFSPPDHSTRSTAHSKKQN
uniref:Lysophosphatidylcholine acyltransferase 1 n=2 Tax=Cyprinus carpio TaxID=7962 RepID=A0A9J7XYZ7_CYPCA